MLGKLIGYEYKSIGRLLLPLYFAAIILSVITGIGIKINGSDNSILNMVDKLGFVGNTTMFIYGFFFVVVLIGTLSLSFVYGIVRFKANMLDKEGYLMHTLPVSKNQHILAKLVGICTFQILGVLIFSASYVIMISITYIGNINVNMFSDAFKVIFDTRFMSGMLEAVVTGLISLILFNLRLYACVSAGYSFNSHRLVCSICALIVVSIVEGIVVSSALSAINIGVIQYNVVNIVLIVVYWAITAYYLKNKLNLQ